MASRLKWLSVFLVSFFCLQSVFAGPGPQFTKKNILLTFKNNKKKLILEAAETGQQHAYGLMNRTSMGKDEGMIFIFQDEQVREFWMKDTLIDLDIAYIGKNKKIVDIQTMKAITSIMQTKIPTYPSKLPAQYAIEMNSGWFKKHKFGVGTSVSIEAGPMSKPVK